MTAAAATVQRQKVLAVFDDIRSRGSDFEFARVPPLDDLIPVVRPMVPPTYNFCGCR